MFCKNCWANIPDGTTECPKCKKDPGVAPEPPPAATSPPTSHNPARPPQQVPDFQGDGAAHSGPFGYSPLKTTALIVFICISGWLLYAHRPQAGPAAAPRPAPVAPATKASKPRSLLPDPLDVTTVVKSRGEEVVVEGGLDEIEFLKPTKEASSAYKAFESGNYLKASILFKTAIEDRPYDRSLKEALAATLMKRGRIELKAGEYGRAGGLIEEALTYDDNQKYYLSLANAYVGLGNSDSAIKVFEKVRSGKEARRQLVSLYTTLGNKSYQDGDYDEALKFFTDGLGVDPGNEYFKTRVTNIRARVPEVESGYREKKGFHFTVRYEGGTDSVAGQLVAILLEEAYIKVGADLGYYPGDKVGAVLYPEKKFHDITRSPKWAGALYDGRIKIPSGGLTRRTRTLEKVIFHEYTHALVHRMAKGRAPKWLNEGLAQIEESKKGRDYRGLLKGVAARRNFSLRQMESSFMGYEGEDVAIAYAISLSATEYIVREYGLFTVVRILKGIGEGLTTEQAVLSATYLGYDDLSSRWLLSIR